MTSSAPPSHCARPRPQLRAPFRLRRRCAPRWRIRIACAYQPSSPGKRRRTHARARLRHHVLYSVAPGFVMRGFPVPRGRVGIAIHLDQQEARGIVRPAAAHRNARRPAPSRWRARWRWWPPGKPPHIPASHEYAHARSSYGHRITRHACDVARCGVLNRSGKPLPDGRGSVTDVMISRGLLSGDRKGAVTLLRIPKNG